MCERFEKEAQQTSPSCSCGPLCIASIQRSSDRPSGEILGKYGGCFLSVFRLGEILWESAGSPLESAHSSSGVLCQLLGVRQQVLGSPLRPFAGRTPSSDWRVGKTEPSVSMSHLAARPHPVVSPVGLKSTCYRCITCGYRINVVLSLALIVYCLYKKILLSSWGTQDSPGCMKPVKILDCPRD
jgi:hypothetical protein